MALCKARDSATVLWVRVQDEDPVGLTGIAVECRVEAGTDGRVRHIRAVFYSGRVRVENKGLKVGAATKPTLGPLSLCGLGWTSRAGPVQPP